MCVPNGDLRSEYHNHNLNGRNVLPLRRTPIRVSAHLEHQRPVTACSDNILVSVADFILSCEWADTAGCFMHVAFGTMNITQNINHLYRLADGGNEVWISARIADLDELLEGLRGIGGLSIGTNSYIAIVRGGPSALANCQSSGDKVTSLLVTSSNLKAINYTK
jgi:hypothetical protein